MTSAAIPTVGELPLAPAERLIVANLGGSPWTAVQLTATSLRSAKDTWRALRHAVGFSTEGGWVTTELTNPKMGKAGIPSIGVTMHAATGAAEVWRELGSAQRTLLADVVETSIDEITAGLARTVCPRSTAGCRAACVPTKSANAGLPVAITTRLNRTLMSMFRPADAFALTGDALRRLQARNGSECRWRVNIADDVRWELVAPGLFSFGVPAYTYTKFGPEDRPGFDGFSVVYSATERTSDDEIGRLVGQGHRVAVVLDVPRRTMPDSWRGMVVSNGDETDDLFEHPAGTVVGLRAKGPTKALLEQMRQSGFARPA